MKKTALFLVMLTFMNLGFAQEEIEMTSSDKDTIAKDLENEAESGKHDKKVNRLLKKMAKKIKESSKTVVVEFKKLDDCVNCEAGQVKPKGQILATNAGRKLGRGAAWITTATGKPFANAAAFVKGLFQKQDKNQDVLALYKFFINNSEEFDKLYLEASTPADMVNLMVGKTQEIVQRKTNAIVRDYLVSLGIKREIPEDLRGFELTSEELEAINLEEVSGDFINNHKDYADLKPFMGEVTQKEAQDVVLASLLNKEVSFKNFKAFVPSVTEGAGALVGQMFAPKIALGVLSSSLSGLYATPVIMANIGTGVSSAICLQKDQAEKFEKDKDLASFCSYVVNRTGYELMKSRAKGFVAGKNTRAKIDKKIQERKERRAKKKAQKEFDDEVEDMIEQLPVH